MIRPQHYWRDGLTMSITVGVVGVTFGVLADAAGFDLPRIVFMSVFVFAGASQFAAVSVIDSGGAAGAAVSSALLLAARNVLYGTVVRRVLPVSLLGRLAAAQFVIDQTAAMAVAQTNRRDATGAFWFTGATLWLCWNAGSVAGALLGPVLGNPETWGLDAALPAIFVALLAPHLGTAAGRVAALAAAAVALGAVPFTAPGLPILLSVVALVPAALVQARRLPPAAGGGESEPESGAAQ